MGLNELNFELEYRSLRKNVIKEFYEPALKKAISYQRAVGFFSSSALIEISSGIQGLIENGGRIQLVASPKLSEEDLEAIQYGYKTREEIIENALLREWKEPQNPFQEKRLNLLANYIAEGLLDIKLAFIHNQSQQIVGIFHEKLGLISDGVNTVAFSGSMNDSKTAYHGNYETIDVFCDWKSAESAQRVNNKKEAFETIWNNEEDNIEVLMFPQILKERIEKYNIGPITDKIDEDSFLEKEREFEKKYSGPEIPEWFEIRDYQKEAVEQWERQNFQGIFDMATGTGKTYTALLAITRMYKVVKGTLGVIILCPYQHLVEQWVEDMKQFNLNPIVAYSASSHKNYKEGIKNAIFEFVIGTRKHFCIICTNDTFKSREMQENLKRLKGNVLLVADEAHNLGAEGIGKTLDEKYTYRLALSATLERHNDLEGTERLLSYFGEKCIEYDLETAIHEEMLTPYYYHPIIVHLAEEELEKYIQITKEIGKCMIKKNGHEELSKKGQMLALKRARLVAGAKEKGRALSDIMDSYVQDSHMLVYCGAANTTEEDSCCGEEEEIRQIDYITKLLNKEKKMRVAQFTSREGKELREERIRHFEEGDIQALIAIKCLDEGVNIPKIKTAFILASTTNPKEYIQRRGRVLRLAKGKEYARIYDFITLPRELDVAENMNPEERKKDTALVKNEILRMQEFKRLSLNPYDSDDLIIRLIDTYHLYEEIEII